MNDNKKSARIYLGYSLTYASEEFKKEMTELRQKLRSKYKINEFLGLTAGSDQDVYKNQTDQLKNSALLLAECSNPSTGLGFEIAAALTEHKPVLAVAKKNAVVSRLILGIDNSLFSFVRYNNLNEIQDTIEKKLAGII